MTQKRKWMIREYTNSKDLNLSEIKDTEETKSSKYFPSKHNTSVEIEQKSSQMLVNNSNKGNNSIYKTQERMSKGGGSFFKDKNEQEGLIGNQSNTLKRKQWKIKYSLKSHLDAVRSLYFNMSMNILASASED